MRMSLELYGWWRGLQTIIDPWRTSLPVLRLLPSVMWRSRRWSEVTPPAGVRHVSSRNDAGYQQHPSALRQHPASICQYFVSIPPASVSTSSESSIIRQHLSALLQYPLALRQHPASSVNTLSASPTTSSASRQHPSAHHLSVLHSSHKQFVRLPLESHQHPVRIPPESLQHPGIPSRSC